MIPRPGSANGQGSDPADDPAADPALISNRFALGELLGSGGSASVFAATDLTATDLAAHAAVALKVLHPRLSGPEATREAFFRQARAASAIRHHNVAGVVALGTDLAQSPPVVWIAFERAPGVSLTERVDERGPLDSAEVVALADGMLRGLAAAHAAGVIHRDLSPGNVMVPLDTPITPESVRIIDFGLADAAGRPVLGVDVVRTATRPASAEPEPGVWGVLGVPGVPGTSGAPAEAGVLGTVHYLSPEQARGEAVDERSDLYQLAAVLYFAVTGEPPYLRDSAEETISAHLHAPPPIPSAVRAGVPRELDRLVAKGMLKSPHSRFASAEAMREALITVAAHRPTLPPESNSPETGTEADLGPAAARTVAPTRRLPNPATAATHVLRGPNRSSLGPGSSSRLVGGARARPVRAGWLAGISVAALTVLLGGFIAASGNTLAPVVVTSPSSTPSDPAATPTTPPPPETTTEVDVPTLSRLTLAAARSALAHAGLTVGVVTLEDSAEPEGTVIASSRSAGERAEPGWSVDLVVASGWNLVPAVVGLSATEASAVLVAAGFTVSVATGGSATGGHSGAETVLAADPAGGTRAPLGRSILITVATTPVVAPSPSISPSATPVPTPTENPGPTSPPGTPPTPAVP